MSFALDTTSSASRPSALIAGYAAPPAPDQDRIICPPWTGRDIDDMENLQCRLGWLLDEIKSGRVLTEERHGFTLRSVIAASLALAEKERAWREKYDPHRPRVLAGQTGGGQWTDGGGVTLPHRKPACVLCFVQACVSRA